MENFNNIIYQAWCEGRFAGGNHVPYANILLASAIDKNIADPTKSQIRVDDDSTRDAMEEEFHALDEIVQREFNEFEAQHKAESDETQALLQKEFDETQALVQREFNETQVKLDTLINAVNHNTTQMQTLLNSIIENTRQGIKSITATINNNNPKVGQTGVKVSATIILDNDLPAPDKPVFSSNNTGVATIDQDGNVTLRSAGNVTFTAAARDEKGTVTITVAEAE